MAKGDNEEWGQTGKGKSVNPKNAHKLPEVAKKKTLKSQDGSNAIVVTDLDPAGWNDGAKKPYSYNVVDRFGQHYVVWKFPYAGGIIEPHSHKYDHCSMLIQGSVTVTGDEEREDYSVLVAEDVLFFKAGTKHSIRAVVDKTILVHSYPPGFVPDNDA